MRGTSLFFYFFISPSFITASSFSVHNAFANENVSLISKEKFLSSDFPKLFKKQKFDEALEVFDSLSKPSL